MRLRWPNWKLGAWSPANEIAVDLGTANTLIYVKGEGIVLNEPSVVAIEKATGKIKGIGLEAKRMLGRTPDGILAVRPLKDGVIADFDVTERMLRYFIQKVHRRSHMAKPRLVVAVPSGITGVEQSAVKEAGHQAGARRVYIIEEPMAAAIGAGLPKTVVISAAEVRKAIEEPVNLVVDAVKNTLDKCPPELAGDVMDRGIALTGGGALLRGLESRIREETGMPVQVADNPLDSVVLGTGKCVEDFETLRQVLVPDTRR